MSIGNKITQLTTARNNIRAQLVNKGISASNHGFADFTNDIFGINTSYATGTFTFSEDTQLLSIHSLSFRPKYIAVRIQRHFGMTTQENTLSIIEYFIDFTENGTTEYQFVGIDRTSEDKIQTMAQKSSNSNVRFEAYNDGFEACFSFSSGTLPAYYKAGYKFTWIAIGNPPTINERVMQTTVTQSADFFQTFTIYNVPFTVKKICLSSCATASMSISSDDTNKYIFVLNIDIDGNQNYIMTKYWRTDYVTPKAGFGRNGIDKSAIGMFFSQSGTTVTVTLSNVGSPFIFAGNKEYNIVLIGE